MWKNCTKEPKSGTQWNGLTEDWTKERTSELNNRLAENSLNEAVRKKKVRVYNNKHITCKWREGTKWDRNNISKNMTKSSS